jgi:hypothetical protein
LYTTQQPTNANVREKKAKKPEEINRIAVKNNITLLIKA